MGAAKETQNNLTNFSKTEYYQTINKVLVKRIAELELELKKIKDENDK